MPLLHLWSLLAALVLGATLLRGDETKPKAEGVTSENNERLRKGLKKYPEADSNHDGVLTMEEAQTYLAKIKSAGDDTQPKTTKSAGLTPTVENAKYGPYERNVLDFWQAKSDKPTPLVIYIHGGGFRAGDKSGVRGSGMAEQCLNSGVSFAAINYRYRTTAPIQDVLRDCARAVQFLRSKAGEWNIDKTRVASYGGSAGAGTSLWLAFHDDLADPQNSDPVLRESTRLACAGATSCQFSYDVLQWPKLFGKEVCDKFSEPNENWPAFYGLKTDEELRGPAGQKVRADCDMCGLIKKGAPPVFLDSKMRGGDVTDRGQYLHHPKHAEAIKKRCDELGVECVAEIPALNLTPQGDEAKSLREFLLQHLGVKLPDKSVSAK